MSEKPASLAALFSALLTLVFCAVLLIFAAFRLYHDDPFQSVVLLALSILVRVAAKVDLLFNSVGEG